MTDVIDPPSAPSAPAPTVTPAPAAAPSAPKPAAPSKPAAPAASTKPVKPASAKDDAFSALDRMAKVEPVKPPVTEAKPKETNEDLGNDERGDADNREMEEGLAEGSEKPSPTTEQKPDGKKPNPWRLADEWKKKATEAQKIIEELKTKAPADDAEKKTLMEKLTAKDAREKELVDELKFYNFEKHDSDFKANFDEPYKAAWSLAVEEISQFPVTLDDGSTRAANASDLLKLVNLPPVEARELAEQLFGKYADDVLMERKRVREKFDARARALDSAKRGLNQTQQERAQKLEQERTHMRQKIDQLWNTSQKTASDHPDYGEFFKPIEGDQEGNLRLSKGYELVDRGLAEDPNAPGLTDGQRADIVKRHAFIYHRAAAFGRTLGQLKAAKAKLAALAKELEQYKASEPGSDEGARRNGVLESKVTGMEGAFAALEKYAR
jgi:hypothetical protein